MNTHNTTDFVPPSFMEGLRGPRAFYLNPDEYEAKTRSDFQARRPLPTCYTWNTESKVSRIAKKILSIIVFPIGVYKLLHTLVGKIALLPASASLLFEKDYAYNERNNVQLKGEWKFKRITIQVDGCKVDAMIMGTADTLDNGRWVLTSLGNGEFLEEKLCSTQFRDMLDQLKGNALLFNYPGVSGSTGWPSRKSSVKAYRAMLNFLEDQNKGIGAKEIIGYGHSIGGGVQSEALKDHLLKTHVKYVFVKSRTFSSMQKTASLLVGRVAGVAVKILGWNFNSVNVSKKLQAPEIILQTAKVPDYEKIHDSSKILHDNVIPKNASLAKALLDDDKCEKQNKVFIGIPERHNEELRNPSFLVQNIERLLKRA